MRLDTLNINVPRCVSWGGAGDTRCYFHSIVWRRAVAASLCVLASARVLLCSLLFARHFKRMIFEANYKT